MVGLLEELRREAKVMKAKQIVLSDTDRWMSHTSHWTVMLVSQGDTACSRRYGNSLYLLIDV
jgi:hypothetical protein